MDAYPEDYVTHNRPFVLLSGLELETKDEPESIDYPLLHERGHKIFSDFPPVGGMTAEELRRVLLNEDASRAQGSSRDDATEASFGAGFKIKSVGRSYRLPPRKADPPPVSPPTSPSGGAQKDALRVPSFVLHSPISPLSPSSPTFPDGLVPPLWVSKHQSLVPAAIVNFFPFSVDPNMNSLRDNQLKIEINGLKKEWQVSGYKTRFLVVLLSEDGNANYAGDTEDRINSIRRATNLDQKSIFLLPGDATTGELQEFSRSLFTWMQPSVAEYYRDLSKHARRKRNRSTIPPPTAPPTSGTSQTLSSQGWNVRYEFKLGVFAEFRQEMDAALRNYESAYSALFGQEVFETIAGWNPRFNDARLLADTLAIRMIRCLLWTGQTAAAILVWVSHRDRTQEIVNRRGKGSRNYGWEAWESRWSMVMAELVRHIELSPQDQYLAPHEKATPLDNGVWPWERLHHEGYWLCRSAKHAMMRRDLAHQIPEEDRTPPGEAPASHIANKSYLYDTYLAPETHVEAPGPEGFDHSNIILGKLKAALEEFSRRGQTRKVESLSLEIAEECIRIESWADALNFLRPLWPTLTWRHSGWWALMERFAWALRECARKEKDAETVLKVEWELLSKSFEYRPSWSYNIHKSLEEFPLEKPKPSVVLRAEDVASSVTATLVFDKAEGNVGEPLQAQLVISSSGHPSAAPIRISEIKVVFEGSLRPIKIQTDGNEDANTTTPCTMASLSLRESSMLADSTTIQSPSHGLTPLTGTGDLTIGPSQTKVLNLTCIPREAGEARVASITLSIEEEKFDLAYVITELVNCEFFWWRETSKGISKRRVGKGRDPAHCKIKPKPPKIRISTPNLRETYYSSERIVLTIDLHNDEEEAAEISVETRLFGHPDSTAKLQWADGESDSSKQDNTEGKVASEEERYLIQRPIGVMERSSKRELVVVLADTVDASDHQLEISAVYHLVSDVQTPIIKTVTVGLSVIRPFEANYEFLPRIHPDPWPDFFQVDDDILDEGVATKPRGLQQRWCLSARTVSFALEPLVIEKVSAVQLGIGGGGTCSIGPEMIAIPETSEISPEELREFQFTLDFQKVILGDRKPTAVDLALEIQWRRRDTGSTSSDQSVTTSTLAIPRFVVPSSEPRVLASAMNSTTLPGLVHVDYTLENPSTHFLTFNLTMEASEQFAFSGSKTTVVQLVPLSRHTVRYNLLASKRGLWIQPQLLVVDTYFNKMLRVLPTEEVRSDKKGILVWVDAED